jgi:multicomponent Na+:H+ antiporter subunit E
MNWLVLFLVTFATWLLLTWSLNWQQVLAGVVLSGAVTALFARIYSGKTRKFLQPHRWLWAILYLPYFFYYCLKANLDVAYRVVHPELPIKPGIVKVKTTLKSDIAKVFLANSITLTPGTLTIDVDGDDFYVHWIYVSTEDPEQQAAVILQRFEEMLRRIFE